jgi:hypothetical protein
MALQPGFPGSMSIGSAASIALGTGLFIGAAVT